MDIHGVLSMDVHGGLSMDIHGVFSKWIFMEYLVNGYSWSTQYTYVVLSMNIHSMEYLHEYSWSTQQWRCVRERIANVCEWCMLQEIARHLRPRTLRALFGKDKIQNGVHCTDLPEDALLEVTIYELSECCWDLNLSHIL